MTQSSLTSGGLRSIFLLYGVPSLLESFQNRNKSVCVSLSIPVVAPSIKVRKVTFAKKPEDDLIEAALVDIPDKKLVYGAVFTSEPEDGPCWHCRRQVDPKKKVGIPLRIRDDRLHHVLIIDMEGRACHYGCALKFLKDHVAEKICFEGRITVLHQINEICAPGTKVIPSPDWRSLKSNGGFLSDEEFDKNAHFLVPTPRLQSCLTSLTFAPSNIQEIGQKEVV